jgi:tetratricopeptide (TPR) repeat protein
MTSFRIRRTVAGRSTVALLSVMLFILLLGVFLPLRSGPFVVLAADNLTSTPISPTPSSDEVLAQAQAALAQANAAANQAQGVLIQASAVSGQAGIVLNFIQVIAIIGGLAAALGGYFFAVRGLRTLNDYQVDLEAARGELNTMRGQLNEATNQALQVRRDLEADSARQLKQVQDQAADAYRAFSLIQIGEQQFAIGNTQAAQQMYEEAYQLNPHSQIVNYLLGELYVIARDLPRAVEYLKRAVDMAPNLAPTYAALGLARRLQADKLTEPLQRNLVYAEAEQLLLKAIQINPGVRDAHKESAYSTLGGLYRRENRIDDALAAYSMAETITPNNSYPVVNLAQLHFLRGDVDKAKSYFSRALAISQRTLDNNPSDPWARFDVITAELALANNEAAFQQLDVTLKQMQAIGPLETLLGGFMMLKHAPQPPPQIDQAITLVEAAIEQGKGISGANTN